MEKTLNTRLKKILIFAVVLNLAIIIMQGFSTVKTIENSRRNLLLIGRTALSTFEGGRRAMFLLNQGNAKRFRSFIDTIGVDTGVKSLYLFDMDGNVLLNTKDVMPPQIHPDRTPEGEVKTEDGLFMYHVLPPMRPMMMMRDMGMDQQFNEKPLAAGVMLDTSSYENIARTATVYLFGMVLLELLLVAVYVYTARILKVNADQSKRLEASEREAELGRMSRLMAHELKNPLSTVKGLMEFSAKKSEGDLKEISESCVDELSRLDRIINDYLSYGKDMTITISETNLRDAAESTAKLLSIDAESKGISISIEGNGTIQADSEKMRQIIFNLLMNAVQGAPENSQIDVTLSNKLIRVSNMIKEKDFEQEKLGQPFYTTKTVGTGLGLAIVKRIAQLHGFGTEISTDGRFTVEIRI